MKGAIAVGPRNRTIGVIYLLYFLMAVFSAVLSKGIVISNNAAETAHNILEHEFLFRSSFAINLIAIALYLVLTALFYNLFKPVNRNISLIAAFFSLMGCATQTFASVFQIVPLLILSDTTSEAIFNEVQLQSLSLLSLKLQTQTFNIGLVFFAFYCLLIGYLIVRSTFIPRIFGALLLIAGLGWLTFLAPPLAEQLSRYTQLLGFVAEASLMLWLLVRGVDVHRWKDGVNTTTVA